MAIGTRFGLQTGLNLPDVAPKAMMSNMSEKDVKSKPKANMSRTDEPMMSTMPATTKKATGNITGSFVPTQSDIKPQTKQDRNIPSVTMKQSPANIQQMMTYNVKLKNPSKKYAGLEKEDEEMIDSRIAASGITGTDADILKEEAISNFIKVKQSKAFLEDRETTRNRIVTGELSVGDKKSDDMAYRTSQFADIIRKEALSSGVVGVTGVDDKTIIEGVLEQRPELQADLNRFLEGDLSLNNLNRMMRGSAEVKGKFMNWVADNIGPAVTRGAVKLFGEEDVRKFQEENRGKTFEDVAFTDMGAFPSVLAGAATVPTRQAANAARFIENRGPLGEKFKNIAELFGGGSANIDKVVGYLEDYGASQTGTSAPFKLFGIDSKFSKGNWFDAGKIATEIGVSAIEAAAGMKLLSVGQLGALMNKAPRLTKYIAKPVVEALGFTAAQDLTEGELSSAKEYGINAGINFLTMGLGNRLKDAQISKGLAKAANNININTTDEYIKATKALKDNFSNPSPISKVNDKVMDAIKQIDADRGVAGEVLGAMRNQMKTVAYSIDDAVDGINQALKGNNIGASIVKDAKGVYKVSSKIAKDSGKMSVLREITNALNEGTSKTLGIKNKMAALDKLNQDIIYTIKTQAQGSPLGNALAKASSKFSDTIENTMSGYGFAKGQYAKLAELKNSARALVEGNSTGKLQKLLGAWSPDDTKKLLLQLKELGYTTDDLFSEAIVANTIMKTLLDPSELEMAIKTAYPSVPGLFELGIKGAKSILIDPIKGLRQASKGVSEGVKKGLRSAEGRKAVRTGIKNVAARGGAMRTASNLQDTTEKE